MQKNPGPIRLLSVLIILALSACTTQPTVQPTPDTAEADVVLNTQTIETIIPTFTEVIPTATLTPEPTATSAPTATLEPTATIEPAVNDMVVEPNAVTDYSGSMAYLTLAANTVCRTGPATVYQSVGTIPAGQKVLAVGRLAKDSPYYFIENPNVQDTHCWVFGQGAVIEGNPAALNLIEPLPSPTPATGFDFSVVYSNIKQCGDDYSFSFLVSNTDENVWQSIKVYIVDVKKGVSAKYSSNRFVESVNCHMDNYQEDLAKGERAFMTPFNPGHFDYRPYGGTFLLKVTLCSEDGLKGTCLTREIKVKP